MSENGTDDHLWHVVDKLDDMARDHMHWMQETLVADGSAIDQDDRQFTIMSMRELVDSSVKAALDCIYLASASLLDQEGSRCRTSSLGAVGDHGGNHGAVVARCRRTDTAHANIAACKGPVRGGTRLRGWLPQRQR